MHIQGSDMRGGAAQWVAHLSSYLPVSRSNPIKDSHCFLEKLYSQCLVLLVGSRTDSSMISQLNLNKLRALLKFDLDVK